MAIFSSTFRSKCLDRDVEFQVIIPNDDLSFYNNGVREYRKPKKTLYLLHGYSDCSSAWLIKGLALEVANQYHIAIVMPTGENSFYLDQEKTGGKYGSFIGKELVEYTRETFGLSCRKEDTLIGGLSMGGFGAIHVGLTNKDTFGGIIALSAALVISRIKGMKQGQEDGLANYEYYHSIFGDLENVDKTTKNPEVLICQLLEEQHSVPPIYMACGTEDVLIDVNRQFYQFLCDKKIEKVKYLEEAGIPDWTFWNRNLSPAVQWVLEQMER